MTALIVIPARMAATRLPGKPLADIRGQPIIVHCWRSAVEANIGPVLVAAAEPEIAEAVRAHGGEAILTDPALPSGTDRVAAAVAAYDPEKRFQFIVNVQGDLPNIDPRAIRRSLAGLSVPADISTIAALAHQLDAANPNVVKAMAPHLSDSEIAIADDFLRDVTGHAPPYWHHIGVYAYRREALERFVTLPPSPRETERRLEQLRALENGMRIAVVAVEGIPQSVDTPADLEAVRAKMAPPYRFS